MSRVGGRFLSSFEGGAGSWDEFDGITPEWCQPLFETERYNEGKAEFYRVAPRFLRVMRRALGQDKTVNLPHY